MKIVRETAENEWETTEKEARKQIEKLQKINFKNCKQIKFQKMLTDPVHNTCINP